MALTFVQHSREIVDMYINSGRLITLPQTPAQIEGVLRQSQGYPKPVLEKSHSTPAGFAQQYPCNPTATSQQPQATLQQSHSRSHSKSTAIPRQTFSNSSNTIAMPGQYHSNTTEITSQSHSNTKPIPQQPHSNLTAVLQLVQESHSNTTAIPK